MLERKLAIDALPVDNREAATPAIRPYLYDRSPDVRTWAVEFVRKEFLWELEDRVRELLADKRGYVRHAAVECLGDFYGGDRVEVPWLYSFLRDPDALVRVETLEALAYIGDRQGLPHMVECLQDEERLVRSYAALSIAELKGTQYRKEIELAAGTEEDERSKPFFAQALFLLGDQTQFPRLIALLSSPSCSARCASANGLTDLPLSAEQVKAAHAAVSHALEHFLFRADQSTMERVEKTLRERTA